MPPNLPAPHLVIRDFLSPQEREELLEWTIESETRFKSRTLSANGETAVQKSLLDDLGPSTEVFSNRINAQYADWISKLRLSSFPLSKLELRIGAYNDGARFEYHLDASYRVKNAETTRMLTAVYYYFREPMQFSGGDLRLYDIGAGPGSQAFKPIAPEQNTLLVFPSWVGHDVTTVHCPSQHFADSRFAVNCWLHRPSPEA